MDSTDPTDTGGYGLNDYRVTATFREPRAFGRPGDAQALAFLERGIRASFTFDRVGVRGDYARRFDAGLTATLRYTLENTDIFDEQIEPEDRLLVDRLFPQVRLSTFFGGVLRDSRDDVLDPQRGTLLSLDGAAAARAYGSEIGFVKTFLQGFVYRRLPGRGFVVAGGARVGLSTAFVVRGSACRRERRSDPRGDRTAALRSGRGSAGQRALLRGRRHHRPRLRARSPRDRADAGSARLPAGGQRR